MNCNLRISSAKAFPRFSSQFLITDTSFYENNSVASHQDFGQQLLPFSRIKASGSSLRFINSSIVFVKAFLSGAADKLLHKDFLFGWVNIVALR